MDLSLLLRKRSVPPVREHDCLRMAIYIRVCLPLKATNLLTPLRNTDNDDEIKALITGLWRGRDDRYSEIRLSNTDELKRPKVEMSHIGG